MEHGLSQGAPFIVAKNARSNESWRLDWNWSRVTLRGWLDPTAFLARIGACCCEVNRGIGGGIGDGQRKTCWNVPSERTEDGGSQAWK